MVECTQLQILPITQNIEVCWKAAWESDWSGPACSTVHCTRLLNENMIASYYYIYSLDNQPLRWGGRRIEPHQGDGRGIRIWSNNSLWTKNTIAIRPSPFQSIVPCWTKAPRMKTISPRCTGIVRLRSLTCNSPPLYRPAPTSTSNPDGMHCWSICWPVCLLKRRASEERWHSLPSPNSL